jgi:hypothetical protein
MGNTTSRSTVSRPPTGSRSSTDIAARRAAERAALVDLSVDEIRRAYGGSLGFSNLSGSRGRMTLAGYVYEYATSVYADFCDEELAHVPAKKATGYKVHISINPLALPRAWNDIWPILLKNEVKEFKVLMGAAGPAGKEIVIYLMNDLKTPADWSRIFSEIEGVLADVEPNSTAGAPALRYRLPAGVGEAGRDYFGLQEPSITGSRHCFYTDDSKMGTRDHARVHPPVIVAGMMSGIEIAAPTGAGAASSEGSTLVAAMAPAVAGGVVVAAGALSGGSSAHSSAVVVSAPTEAAVGIGAAAGVGSALAVEVPAASLGSRPSLVVSAPARASAPFAAAAAGGAVAVASRGAAPVMPMGPRPFSVVSAPAPVSAPFAAAAAAVAGAGGAMPMGPPGPLPPAARPTLAWFAASQANKKQADKKSLLAPSSGSSDGSA